MTCCKTSINYTSEGVLVSDNVVVLCKNLFFLSSDEDSDVRKNVCRALVMLIEVRIDRLIPHINNLVEVCRFILDELSYT